MNEFIARKGIISLGNVQISGATTISGVTTLYNRLNATNGVSLGIGSLATNGNEILINTNGIGVGNTTSLLFSNAYGGHASKDVGIKRNSSNTLEIYDGTTGSTNGNLKLNDLISNGTISGNTINVSGVSTNYVLFKTGNTPTLVDGLRRLNQTIGTTEFKIIGHDATLQDGFEVYGIGYNNSAISIPNGTPITIVSGNTEFNVVEPAIASNHTNKKYKVFGVTTEVIPPYSLGIYTKIGEVHDLDLSMFNVNDDVFLSQTEVGKLITSNELNISGRRIMIGKVINNSNTSGILTLDINNESGVSNNTDLEVNTYTINDTSTGVFDFNGISIQSTTGTTFNVGSLRGWIVDNETNPLTPEVTYINFSGATGITTPYLTDNSITYVLIDINSNLYFKTTYPTPIDRRNMIFLGNVGHPNRTTITTAMNNVDSMLSPLSQVRDMFTPISLINENIKLYPSNNLTFNNTSGYLYGFGINFNNNRLDPNRLSVSGSTPVIFKYRTQTGGTETTHTNVDVSHYDLNGVTTTYGSPSKNATNQRIYLLRNGEFRVQYGQTIYTDLSTAISAISTESFTQFGGIKNDGILIGILSVRSDTTNLSDVNYAKFTSVSKFGDVSASAGSSTSTTTLQSAYDNSTEPEITTNSTLDGLTIRRGSSSDSDNLIVFQNGTGSTVTSINAIGVVTANKFVKSGGTSSQFLKADGSVDSNNYSLNGHTHTEYSKEPISITYSGLYTLTQTSGLTIGQRYIINDYQTVHTIPNTSDVNYGEIEQLLVTALSTNKLMNIAYSLTFPQDIIYYDIENNQTMVNGCTKGYIYRRIDTLKNNDIGFDYRNVKFRRWQLNVTEEDGNGNIYYSKGSVVKKTGTNEIYIKLTDAQGTFYDTDKWKRYEFDNLSYIIPQEGDWYLISITCQIILPNSGLYFDYYLFSTVPTVNGVKSSYDYIYNNKFDKNNENLIGGSNTVFFGDYFNFNIIGHSFYSNTIGNNFSSNSIGNNFSSNSIGDYFNFNTIGDGFNFNTIGDGFNFNTIGNNSLFNTIGDYFTHNTIGDGFFFNFIGNNFYSNTIGDDFNFNFIGNNFYSNTIGDDFNFNTIGNNSLFNSIGDDFNSNTIGNNISSNTIGKNFNSNTIGDNFYSNTIGNDFNSNGGLDFITATYVYSQYKKELFTNSVNEQYLRYYDENNVLQIVQANA